VRKLRGLCGEIELRLSYGRDPRDQRWCCPLLESWGVRPHQEFTPAVRRRLALTVSASGTYADAAELATEWGVAVDDSTLHALAQEAGGRAAPADGSAPGASGGGAGAQSRPE
jgi:hypothetical protein